ncbi:MULTISPECIES: glycosyltransferase family 4 protein [unclassified Exiguobacterium]|uniref:glycosyltransferase family 4 protein n=1 Tax=unclassified Exiguobacterium TaxID=2644629 RepID=UPI001BE65404|nr:MULTISPECIES: glycosyltransferase family 4 protein [unclassified Exiguobacterium]
MKKILIVSTVSRQFYLFEQANIEVLNSLGYEVHAAANYSDANERLNHLNIIRHHINIERSPVLVKNNYKAYKQLKNLMIKEKFDIVHCHSPMGGVIARLAAKNAGIKNVIYTAHGFHFYKGAPMINWILYYPVEKVLSKITRTLITINQEDYNISKKFYAKDNFYIPGIGVDVNEFSNSNETRQKIRKEFNIPLDAFVILSVGELNKNKNHEVVIKALSKINNPKIYYLVCGQGDRMNYLEELILSSNLSANVKLLGFRNDVINIYRGADLFAFPSYREGLSVSLMEAMSMGLPVICSKIRGNIDLIQSGEGGLLFDPNNPEELAYKIKKLLDDEKKMLEMGNNNLKNITKYDISKIKLDMKIVYERI